MIAMTIVADVAVALGDADWAKLIYDRLMPYANTTVVIGIAAVCLGSTARYLGRLALVMDDRARALEHLEQAMAVNQALVAPLQIAHTELDLAAALGPGARAQELVENAARTARELAIPALAKRLP
jgi:hypothetical protein